MTSIFSFFLMLILSVLSLHPQKVIEINPKPYDTDYLWPGYSITQPNFVYREEYPQFQDLDFENFILHTFDEKNRHDVCGQLHKGLWEDRDKDLAGMESLTWGHAYPLRSDGPSVQYVLAYFTYFGVGGSSESEGYAQVWRLQDSKLTIVQQIQFNTHFAGLNGTFVFKKQSEILTVRASHYLPGDAHCCISAYDELTFR